MTGEGGEILPKTKVRYRNIKKMGIFRIAQEIRIKIVSMDKDKGS